MHRFIPLHHLKGPKSDMHYRLKLPIVSVELRKEDRSRCALWVVRLARGNPGLSAASAVFGEALLEDALIAFRFRGFGRTKGGDISVTPFDERNLVQAACAFRLFSQEVELSLSTRESERFRNHAFQLASRA